MLPQNTFPGKTTLGFPVVGIGASAGSLDAVSRLLRSIPEKSGMAYLLFRQHAPGQESLFPVLLDCGARIPVAEAREDALLVRDTIYVIPDTMALMVRDGRLKLATWDSGSVLHPIDNFFASLAGVYQRFTRGVLLSGAGNDGIEGLRIIMEYGGSTIAQAQEEGAKGTMPLGAIRAGAADFVVNADEIPGQLMKINRAYENSPASPDKLQKGLKTENGLFAEIIRLRTKNSLLQRKVDALEERNKELLSFSYIVSHDLQEPLRKIHTFSKLILEDEQSALSGESMEHLDRTLVSIRRMQQLTEDLLSYSHIGSSERYQLFDTDLNMVIRESLDELQDAITESHASITISSLPVVRAVPALARQLFINLISNSLKYAVKDRETIIAIDCREAGSLELSDLQAEHDTRYHKISIKDNGIGFRQEEAIRIFEPFHRLHGKDIYDGTGIGLAICKKFMEKHNGYITAESSPKNGATFNLFFPI